MTANDIVRAFGDSIESMRLSLLTYSSSGIKMEVFLEHLEVGEWDKFRMKNTKLVNNARVVKIDIMSCDALGVCISLD